ncbi:MAG TPA: FAD-dependent oxidoreductase [Streptomyces sp.]
MSAHILVVGGGSSGTLAANRLRCYCDGDDVRITVIDRNATRGHRTELPAAAAPSGPHAPHALQSREHLQLRDAIEFRHAEAAEADVARSRLRLTDGTTLSYDVLVVATGTRPRPEAPGSPLSHGRPSFAARSPGLGDEHGQVPVDPTTRRSRKHPRVFAIGSAGGGPHPSGPVVHAQAEKLAHAVRAFLADAPPAPHDPSGHPATASF